MREEVKQQTIKKVTTMTTMTKEEMANRIAELEAKNAELAAKVESKGDGRKAQVMGIIEREGRVTIKEIGLELGISERNVSSQLSYLRKDGWLFGKDSKGRLYLEKE